MAKEARNSVFELKAWIWNDMLINTIGKEDDNGKANRIQNEREKMAKSNEQTVASSDRMEWNGYDRIYLFFFMQEWRWNSVYKNTWYKSIKWNTAQANGYQRLHTETENGPATKSSSE